jgi:hypothetical protein
MIPKSVQRFSDATNARCVCAEIMRKITSMDPKSGRRFSDEAVRQLKKA